MEFFKIEYDNGYCGCDQEEFIQATDEAEAEKTALEGLHDYAETYEHTAEGYDSDDGWEDEDAESTYYENISYSVTKITKEEYLEATEA